MKRVLVTGATGFIGRHSLTPLLKLGFEVHAVYVGSPIQSDSRVIWHKADLMEDGAVQNICNEIKATHLLHFAWYVNPRNYKTSAENDRWTRATVVLVKNFIENGGTRAVLAGSTMEYDPNLSIDFLKENAPTANHNAYARAKNSARAEVEKIAAENSLSFAWGRIFNLYGPYEARERLVSQVITALLNGQTPQIPTGGLVLDYSYVKDVADAFAKLVASDVTGVVNIGSGEPLSLKEMALAIATLLDKTELVRDVNDTKPAQGPARIVADVSRLRKEVGWKAKYDLKSGLSETIDWWKNSAKQDS